MNHSVSSRELISVYIILGSLIILLTIGLLSWIVVEDYLTWRESVNEQLAIVKLHERQRIGNVPIIKINKGTVWYTEGEIICEEIEKRRGSDG